MIRDLAKPLPSSPYVLVDRRILCHCHIQSGLTYILKNIGSCNSNCKASVVLHCEFGILKLFYLLFRGQCRDTLQS